MPLGLRATGLGGAFSCTGAPASSGFSSSGFSAVSTTLGSGRGGGGSSFLQPGTTARAKTSAPPRQRVAIEALLMNVSYPHASPELDDQALPSRNTGSMPLASSS